ncbi:MAG: hypothetical protein IPL43_07320 [Micropruina sp.]|nr:hypothetical protein [Micropruina sp.]
MLGTFADAVLPDQCSVEAAMVSSGSAMKWFRDTLAGDVVHTAEEKGVVAYDLLNQASKDIPPGNGTRSTPTSSTSTSRPTRGFRIFNATWPSTLSPDLRRGGGVGRVFRAGILTGWPLLLFGTASGVMPRRG